ncbi:MAG: hypothetical protein O2894_01440 [Planctomycetota bacterium]|nr:hypothetical protein [Planctomycetota bacterium]
MRATRGGPEDSTMSMRTLAWAAAILFVATSGTQARAEDLPYPAGRSTQQIEGLTVELALPASLDQAKPASLVVILHGAGGSATGMAAAMREWCEENYVVCAPKSGGDVWSDADVKRVKKIAQHLMAQLPIDAKKLHVVGYSNGGWNLPPLAFDEDLKPRTATWVASGFRGASPPKWALALSALALAGTRDANAASARETVKLLEEKVAIVEARFQPELGHEWPAALMPYFRWWMGAREGRAEPGDDMNFAWGSDVGKALEGAAGDKKGGVLLYAYRAADGTNDAVRLLQTEIFMDADIRHLGGQLHPTKVDAGQDAERFAGYGVKTYPAIVVLKKDGKVSKVLEGASLTQRKIAAALRAVAAEKRRPE